MQFFARRVECKHLVWAGPLTSTAATLNVAEELRGRICPTPGCGGVVHKVEFVAVKSTSPFDEPPAPRNRENKLKKASQADLRKTGQHLTRLGARIDGLAANLKEEAVKLTPPDWRGSLSKIPVGVLQTYEPNAECIGFKDSAMPAIVFHQGLAGYLFKMNRSIFPLLRMGSLADGPIRSFAENGKTRSALRVQAVDTALEFLGVGKPRSKVLVEIPMIARLLEMPLTRTMSAFLLCHEYGHAVLNHTDELRAVGGDTDIYLRSRAMEFEADIWGQDAVIGAFTGGKNLEHSLDMLDDLFSTDASLIKQDIAHAAPCVALLYFEFIDVVEEHLARHGIDVAAQSASQGKYRRHARMAEGPTHPSNKERFQALYTYLSEHGNHSAHTWVESFELLLNEIKDNLDQLIDKTGAITGKRLERRFQRPWSKKKRGSSSWRDTMTHIDDDEDARLKVEGWWQNLDRTEGRYLKLDEAHLRRTFEDQKNRANKHLERKEYAEAEKIYTQILDAGEWIESVPLYFQLGTCREEIGDQDGAIAAFRRCIEIVPGSDVAALCGFSLGRILLFDRKDESGAEAALTAATTSHSPDIRLQAMFWLGKIVHDRRDLDDALRWYRKIWAERDIELKIFPTVVAHAALNMGNVFRYRGQFEDATKMFEYARDHPAIEPENHAIAEDLLRGIRGSQR